VQTFMSRLERVQSEQGRAASQQARMCQPHDGRVYIYDIMQPREGFPPTEPMPAHSFPCMAQGYVQPPLKCSTRREAAQAEAEAELPLRGVTPTSDAACLSPQQAHSCSYICRVAAGCFCFRAGGLEARTTAKSLRPRRHTATLTLHGGLPVCQPADLSVCSARPGLI